MSHAEKLIEQALQDGGKQPSELLKDMCYGDNWQTDLFLKESLKDNITDKDFSVEGNKVLIRNEEVGYIVGDRASLYKELNENVKQRLQFWLKTEKSLDTAVTLREAALEDTRNAIDLDVINEMSAMAEESLKDKAAGQLGAKLNTLLREGWKVVEASSIKGYDSLSDLDILGPLPSAKVKQLISAGVLLVKKDNLKGYTPFDESTDIIQRAKAFLEGSVVHTVEGVPEKEMKERKKVVDAFKAKKAGVEGGGLKTAKVGDQLRLFMGPQILAIWSGDKINAAKAPDQIKQWLGVEESTEEETLQEYICELNEGELALILESPEQEAQAVEFLTALEAAQIPFTVDVAEETEELVIGWPDEHTGAVENALKATGISVVEDEAATLSGSGEPLGDLPPLFNGNKDSDKKKKKDKWKGLPPDKKGKVPSILKSEDLITLMLQKGSAEDVIDEVSDKELLARFGNKRAKPFKKDKDGDGKTNEADTYKVMGKSKAGTEELDSFDNEKEAEKMAAEYRMSFGKGWKIWVVTPNGKSKGE
jgi:hypothetical protein